MDELAQNIMVRTSYVNSAKVVELCLRHDDIEYVITHKLVNGELRYDSSNVPTSNRYGQTLLFYAGVVGDLVRQYLNTGSVDDLKAIGKKIRE